MEKKLLPLVALVSSVFSLKLVSAHCPLCTIGAGAAAAGAVWLGVSKVIVALFIGAFATSMGMWFSKLIKKKYVPLQKTIIILVVFLTTILPLTPLFSSIGPLHLSFIGEYGKTYALNYSIGSSLLGGLIVFVSPSINSKIKEISKGKKIPFQGVLLTFVLLLISATIMQLIL